MTECILRGNTLCGAVFSPCMRYRYALWRVWGCEQDPHLVVIGLNPSTADEAKNDPTIRRCIGFAKSWGFAGLSMLNLFAFRATHPEVMMSEQDPIGPENDRVLAEFAGTAPIVLAAWGNLGAHRGRDRQVAALRYPDAAGPQEIGSRLSCLGITKEGFPRHPLYMPKEARRQPFKVRQ